MRQLQLKNLTWIDILKPQEKDIDFLRKNFDFHPLILREIKNPTFHPLFESYENYLYWILHFPSWGNNSHIVSQEVDFLITKDALITIRYRKFGDFEEIFKKIEKNQNNLFFETSSHLFYQIVKQLFDDTFPELDKIEKKIDQIEEKIFVKFDEGVIEKMAEIKFNIIDFIKAAKPQQFIWQTVQDKVLKFWGAEFKPYFSDLFTNYHRVLHIIETQQKVIDTLYSSSDALLSNKRNYVIKILTIFTAILLPLSLVASLYGMNLKYLPLSSYPFAFWGFVIFMGLVSLLALIYFKFKKWL
ncbi:MAG: magnesium transporter CorA family protein [Patescibacteria group bacterium]